MVGDVCLFQVDWAIEFFFKLAQPAVHELMDHKQETFNASYSGVTFILDGPNGPQDQPNGTFIHTSSDGNMFGGVATPTGDEPDPWLDDAEIKPVAGELMPLDDDDAAAIARLFDEDELANAEDNRLLIVPKPARKTGRRFRMKLLFKKPAMNTAMKSAVKKREPRTMFRARWISARLRPGELNIGGADDSKSTGDPVAALPLYPGGRYGPSCEPFPRSTTYREQYSGHSDQECF